MKKNGRVNHNKKRPKREKYPKESLFLIIFDFILLSAPFCDFSEIKNVFVFDRALSKYRLNYSSDSSSPP